MDYLNYVALANTGSDDKIYGNLKDHTNVLYHSPVWVFPKPLPPKAYEWALWWKEQTYEYCVQKSNKGGFQSPARSWEEFEFKYHIQSILDQFEEFKDFKFTNWWLNINEKGDWNSSHIHPGSDLSGIWYITDNEGQLVFEDPHYMTRSYVINHVLKNPIGRSMKCAAGDLILFPSDLQHYVEEHTLDTPRISVSFNMRYKD